VLSVLKLGGSVLRDGDSYAAAARFLRDRLDANADERLVVIVSACYGTTDALLAQAHAIVDDPSDTGSGSAPDAAALDLLWSTGELRSVAILTLHLQRIGVPAVPFNVHQTGLVADRGTGTAVRPLRLLAALGRARIVIVPGFLGVSAGGTITSLGRGGSDLTAVLLAAGVRADACELIKDVPGYFTADPHRDAAARQIHHLSLEAALAMADAGCDLVQRAALAAAAAANLPLVIRSMDAAAPVTHLQSSIAGTESASRNNRSLHHGIRHQDDTRRAAVGA
jgi:aspartate kinase